MFLGNGRHGVAMLMSVFVQNIIDMIVDYAWWVAVLKKEFRKLLRADCSREPDEKRW